MGGYCALSPVFASLVYNIYICFIITTYSGTRALTFQILFCGFSFHNDLLSSRALKFRSFVRRLNHLTFQNFLRFFFLFCHDDFPDFFAQAQSHSPFLLMGLGLSFFLRERKRGRGRESARARKREKQRNRGRQAGRQRERERGREGEGKRERFEASEREKEREIEGGGG